MKDDGGPAYPRAPFDYIDSSTGLDWESREQKGMTLRDWFAAHCTTFTIYDGERLICDEYNDREDTTRFMAPGDVSRGDALAALARLRYEEADAMLKERKAEGESS